MGKLRPLLLFFPLAFLLSWYPYLLDKTHLLKTSGGMNPLGVMLAGIIAAGICFRGGVRELLGRYLRWRIAGSNYAFAILVPVALVFLSAILNLALGAAHPTRELLAAWPDIFPRFVFIFFFIGVGEETGWRGFALPELQKHCSPLAASLILGVFWAAWHIPLFGVEFQAAVIPPFLLSVLAGSVTTMWLFNHSRGSLLPLPLFHATVNAVGSGYIFPMFTGSDQTRLWWLCTALWIITASLLAVHSSRMRVPPAIIESPPRYPRRT